MPAPLFTRSPGSKRRPSTTHSESPSAKRKKEDSSTPTKVNDNPSRPFRYPPHTKVLGIVSSICSDRLLIDLPCGQTAYVPIKEALGEGEVTPATLSTVYQQGQFVICQVLPPEAVAAGGPKGFLPLTLRPAVLNSSMEWPPVKNQLMLVRITSIEEHGFHGSIDNDKHPYQVFVKGSCETPSPQVNTFHFVTVEAVKKESKLVVCRFGDDAKMRYISVNSEADKGSLLAGQLCECAVAAVTAAASSSQSKSSSASDTVLPVKKKHPITKCFPQGIAALDLRLANTLSAIVPRLHLHHPLGRTVTATATDNATASAAVWPFKVINSSTRSAEEVSPKNVQKRLNTWPIQSPRFGVNERFLGRIIAVIPGSTGTASSATLIVSALGHVVHLQNHFVIKSLLPLRSGSKVTDARIADIESGVGVRAFASEESSSPSSDATDEILKEWKMQFSRAFLIHCPVDKIADEGKEAKMLKMNIGQHQEFRVLNVNLFDAIVNAGMADSLLQQTYVGIGDAAVGSLVKGTVLKRHDNYLLIELSPHLRARVRKDQMSDVITDEMPSTYKEASTHKFRVLTVEQGRQLISLTSKKSFMNISDDHLFKHLNPEKVQVNDVLEAYISAVMPFGIIVRGFGDFSALCPFTDIVSTLEGREINDQNLITESMKAKILNMRRYKQGASIRVRICRAQMKNSKLHLTASIDLDRVSPAMDTALDGQNPSAAEGRSNSLNGLPSFHERQKMSATLPFTVKMGTDTVESVAEKALQSLGGAGAVVEGRVHLKDNNRNAISVVVWGRLRAWVHAMEITESPNSRTDPISETAIGDIVKVRLLGVAPEEALPRMLESCMQDGTGDLNLVEGTLRSIHSPVLPRSVKDLSVGRTYAGVIRSSSTKGIYVYLSGQCYVRVKVRELAGRKVQKILATGQTMWDQETLTRLFPPGKVLTSVRILSVSLGKNQAEGSLKADVLSDLVGRKGLVTYENLEEGDKVVAVVKRMESFGTFVTLHNSDGLDALCPTSEIVDAGVTLDQKLEPGDHVVVKVLRKDDQRRRVTVGMKKSYFTDLDIARALERADEGGQEDDETGTADIAEVAEESEEDELQTSTLSDNECTESVSTLEDTGTPRTCDDEDMLDLERGMADDDCDGEDSVGGGGKNVEILQKLSSITSRDWVGSNDTTASLANDDDDVMKKVREYASLSRMSSTVSPSTGGKGAASADLDLENEKLTREIERRNASGMWESQPKTEDDFERLVLISGDEAGCWITYMAYHIKLQDVEMARKIARRGIDTVVGDEKLKIWIGWINLELNFGDKVKEVVEEALQYNDPKTVYFHMIGEYEKRGNWKALDDLADRMMKKLASDPTVWARYLASLYLRDLRTAQLAAPLGDVKDLNVKLSVLTRSRIDETLRKALHRTDKTAHIELQTTVGRFEFRYGSPERGRTIFAKLLAEKPKRTDIWNLLFDAQISALKRNSSKSERSAARQLFIEGIKVALKPSKMRPIFARWQAFEKAYGDEENLALCHQAARSYVQSAMSSSGA